MRWIRLSPGFTLYMVRLLEPVVVTRPAPSRVSNEVAPSDRNPRRNATGIIIMSYSAFSIGAPRWMKPSEPDGFEYWSTRSTPHSCFGAGPACWARASAGTAARAARTSAARAFFMRPPGTGGVGRVPSNAWRLHRSARHSRQGGAAGAPTHRGPPGGAGRAAAHHRLGRAEGSAARGRAAS